MEKNLIIDANNLLHRVWWISNQAKQDMVAVHFLNSLKKYVKQFKPDNIYLAWDKKLKPKIKNFRQLANETDYKGTREYNRDVYLHESLIINLCSQLNVKNIFPGVLEGDDVISWLANKLKGERVIVSVDHDFLQLVSLENVCVYNPIKNIIYDKDEIVNRFGVQPNQFLSYKALIGDKSDNLPGIPRVGKKTALKILAKGIETLCEDHKKIYNKNILLMDLMNSCRHHHGEEDLYNEQYSKLKLQKINLNNFFKMCEENNFQQIIKNKHEWRASFTGSSTLANIINSIGKY